MKADRLREALGQNIAESVSTDRAAGLALPGGAGGAAPVNRYLGLARARGGGLLIPLDRIDPDPDQPRREFDPDALERLARSMRDRGQLQPCRVRHDGKTGRWIVLAGERRFRAAQLAGLPALECVDTPGELTPDQILDDQLTENCLREDLKPVEQAQAFRSLMDRRGIGAKELAEHLHLSVPSVYAALSLLTLPTSVREAVDTGELPATAAREIARLASPQEQEAVAEHAVAEGLTREQVAETVRTIKSRSLGRRSSSAHERSRAPETYDVGHATVTIRWKRAGGPDATQTLRAALKLSQANRGTESAA